MLSLNTSVVIAITLKAIIRKKAKEMLIMSKSTLGDKKTSWLVPDYNVKDSILVFSFFFQKKNPIHRVVVARLFVSVYIWKRIHCYVASKNPAF